MFSCGSGVYLCLLLLLHVYSERDISELCVMQTSTSSRLVLLVSHYDPCSVKLLLDLAVVHVENGY